jgi:hypothetical protein
MGHGGVVNPLQTIDLAAVAESLDRLRADAGDGSRRLTQVAAELETLRRRAGELLAVRRRELAERARIARIGGARLLSNVVLLNGSASARVGVRRLRAGAHVERSIAEGQGLTRSVTTAPDVRAAWDLLLARERATDGVLRAHPATILDVPGAVVSRTASGALDVSLRHPAAAAPAAEAVLAVPRFVHATQPRKLANISHWLLDCLPQVVALTTVAPEARVVVPQPLKEFQRITLELAGLTPAQTVPWAGDPIAADRVVILESDGRLGGGRPLSPLLDLRRIVTETGPSGAPPARRIYVSRRDARKKRQWASNEPAVEDLFASRGFEIVCPTDYPLPALVQMFRQASVVAGLNGAGLAHLLFSPPGTHVIVLLTTSLIRWYSRSGDSRALWLSDHHSAPGELAALGDSPRFYAHVAAAFGQYCHSLVSDDDVPIDEMTVFLDDVLEWLSHR